MRKVRLTQRTGSGLARELVEAGRAALSPNAHTFNHKHKAERTNTVGEEVNSKGSPSVTWLLLCSPKGSLGSPKLHHQLGPCVQKTRAWWRGHFSFKPPQFSSWTAMSGQCCEFSESVAISSGFGHS